MSYRVVHCGTGNVGSIALRSILRNPQLELVGHFVASPEKIGRDSGELVGVGPAGVCASGDWAELLELDADCLIYFGNSLGREAEAIDDLVPFLERGTNVVTYSGFDLAHPPSTPTAIREKIDAACSKGNSSCFFTGIDPGWATTDLAIAALAVADRIECVRVLELGYFGTYTSEIAMRQYFGFGQPPEFEPLFVKGNFIEMQWGPTLRQIAEVLEMEIEDYNLTYERKCLDHDIETGFGTVKAGTAVMVRFEYQALSGGKPFAVVEHVDSVTHEAVGDEWKRPYGPSELAYRIEVTGDPSFSLELNRSREGFAFAAMPVINAIPSVCAARSGLLGPLDIPRYWSNRRVERAD